MPYFGLASLTDPAPQTLGATSFPCFGKASLPKVADVAALSSARRQLPAVRPRE
jgi:hypothetical protein